MNSQEKAPAPRIPLKLDVEFKKSYARSPETGRLRNISLTGAFLEHANIELRANDKVAIVFKVSGRIRRVNASIVWSNELGCGLKFLPDSNRDMQIVDDLMYFVESKRENRRNVLDDIFKQVA